MIESQNRVMYMTDSIAKKRSRDLQLGTNKLKYLWDDVLLFNSIIFNIHIESNIYSKLIITSKKVHYTMTARFPTFFDLKWLSYVVDQLLLIQYSQV